MADEVHALVERYSPFTGRAWLEVRGRPTRVVEVDAAYAATRDRLRAEHPDRPWDADWRDGAFWPSPWGRPPIPVVGAALLGVLAVAGLVGAAVGPPGVLVVSVCAVWPLVRLLDGVSITARGVRIGPPWAMRTPWHEVEAIGVASAGRARAVWVRGTLSAATATVPPALVPAVKARIRRLGALVVVDGDGGLDVRYARWRAAAAGLPWGVLAGTAAGLPFVARPFEVATVGLLVAAALGALGAAVEARATGWGTGAVGWLVVVYGVVLAALALGGA